MAAQKKVKIKLPISRNEKEDVFVGINGKTYLIKRGVEVEVPESVAKVLERRYLNSPGNMKRVLLRI